MPMASGFPRLSLNSHTRAHIAHSLSKQPHVHVISLAGEAHHAASVNAAEPPAESQWRRGRAAANISSELREPNLTSFPSTSCAAAEATRNAKPRWVPGQPVPLRVRKGDGRRTALAAPLAARCAAESLLGKSPDGAVTSGCPPRRGASGHVCVLCITVSVCSVSTFRASSF